MQRHCSALLLALQFVVSALTLSEDAVEILERCEEELDDGSSFLQVQTDSLYNTAVDEQEMDDSIDAQFAEKAKSTREVDLPDASRTRFPDSSLESLVDEPVSDQTQFSERPLQTSMHQASQASRQETSALVDVPVIDQIQFAEHPTQPSVHRAAPRSLLSMSSQASQRDTSELVSRLSHAVTAQSKAMVVLESEVEQLSAREIAFEKQEEELWSHLSGKPTCADYRKGGQGPITNKEQCKDACISGEGLYEGSFKGSNTTAKCDCRVKQLSYSKYQTICARGSGVSLSLLATLGVLAILLRRD